MGTRADRLKRLVRLQEQIKALHETRHAAHLSKAREAREETSELLAALNAASPLPGLFPDIYNRRIGVALAREEDATRNAAAEAGKVATATVRTSIVERAYREAFRLEEREMAEKEQLETIERGLKERK